MIKFFTLKYLTCKKHAFLEKYASKYSFESKNKIKRDRRWWYWPDFTDKTDKYFDRIGDRSNAQIFNPHSMMKTTITIGTLQLEEES